MKKDAFVFDFDGTLIDSTIAHAKSFKDAFEDVGIKVSMEEILKEIGKRAKEIAKKFCPEKWEDVYKNKMRYFIERYAEEVKLREDVVQIAREMKEQGYVLTIFSSASKRDILFFLGKFRILDLFEKIVGAEDVKRGKPDPEGLFILSRDYNILAYIGDTEYDKKTAEAAGVEYVDVENLRRWWNAFKSKAMGKSNN